MSHRHPGLTLVLLLTAALQTVGAPAAGAAVPDLTTDSRPRFLVGASTPDERLGQLDLERVFRAELASPDSRPTATTFTVWDEGALRAWVRAAPAGSAVDFWHEPENDPQAMPRGAVGAAHPPARRHRRVRASGRPGHARRDPDGLDAGPPRRPPGPA